MNERTIQRALSLERHSGWAVWLPNYTPAGWFECDVAAVTNRGYLQEFEIKLTRSDFAADAKKAGGRGMRTKHERLAGADVQGPKQFWFVVPIGLVEPDETPPWAGLIHVEADGHYTRQRQVKPAPVLHGQKTSRRTVRHMQRCGYFRYVHRLIDDSVRADQAARQAGGAA